ncbi:MAG TPA: ribokinase [Candidatus Limnocylindrales bacterium]|nr:ribokinase [Candidatus Limnocylindrales bacterium]
MTGRVIVVGSVNIDLVVTVARLPAPGETVIGGRFARHHGGKGGNQAVAAARLGVATSFVGAVGDDDFGRAARAALEAEGVDVSGVVTLPAEATGVALIVVDERGENSIAVAGGANEGLRPDHVTAALDRWSPVPGDVVLVGHEIPSVAVAAALRWAGEHGATTLLNPAPATGLDAETVALADLITPNEGELASLHDAGVRAERMLLSLGRQGAELRTPDGTVALPAIPVDAIDSVGAGDTLNGALAASLAAGYSLEEAARRAVVAASLAVTRAGAREGMPTAAELEAVLARTR